MLNLAAIKPENNRAARNGRNGNTSFPPGHSVTNANAGRTVVERIAWMMTPYSERWKLICSTSTHLLGR
ncbi:hypothetical protein D3C76_1444000 [compost metagenome]